MEGRKRDNQERGMNQENQRALDRDVEGTFSREGRGR